MNRIMKETNIPWIGQIPEDWQVRQVKQAFNICKEKANDKNPVVLSLARDSVKIRDISNNEGQLAESYENYNPVKIGDLLLNPMDLYSGANCNMSEVEGVISPAYSKLRAKVDLEPRFFDYYFKTQYWTMAMFAHGKGVSFDNRWTLNNDTLKGYYLPFPSKYEQVRIVKAIKSKEEKINALITNEEKQIEKLKAYKQALISEVVTKGLDPNVPMKDSGVDWIGKIPKNWICSKLKNLLKDPLLYGANSSGKKDGNLRYIRITDITADGVLNDSNILYLGDEGKPYILRDGDLLFARSGATSGKTFLFKDCYGPSCFAGYLIKASLNEEKMLPQYLYYYTQSSIYENWKNQIFIQATIQNISANKYSILEVTVPPISEQHQIINYLSVFINNVDELIIKHRNKIEKLKQFRQSMIYEYVTGKRSVN